LGFHPLGDRRHVKCVRQTDDRRDEHPHARMFVALRKIKFQRFRLFLAAYRMASAKWCGQES
jgi:hypothetical protein